MNGPDYLEYPKDLILKKKKGKKKREFFFIWFHLINKT